MFKKIGFISSCVLLVLINRFFIHASCESELISLVVMGSIFINE